MTKKSRFVIITTELPTIPGTMFKPRPDDMMPANFNYGTVVVRALTIR